MPMCLSLALHMGLAMVLVFMGIFVTTQKTERVPIIPTVGDVSRFKSTFTSPDGPSGKKHKAPSRFEPRDGGGVISDNRTKVSPIDQTGTSPGPHGLPGLIGTDGDITKFLGPDISDHPSIFPRPTTGAKFILFVIDRSGSMVDTFEDVKNELTSVISRLEPNQQFHVILLGEGQKVIENTPRNFVPASAAQKDGFVDFLETVRATGATNPLPALTRAFDLLDKAGPGGKVLYLLTDGAFPDNSGVAALVKARNADKKVRINTILYGSQSMEAQNLLERIAESSGGSYKYTSAGG